MYNVGWFPGIIVTNNNEDVIHGEVYEVSPDTLNRLDEVEGVPYLYKRHNNDDLILYVYNRDIKDLKQIKNGVFDVGN